MKYLPPSASRGPAKFRMPTAENLVPVRLDIENDGQRFKDAFTWNINDPDSEVINFAKRTVKDLKLPPTFMTHIAHSIQSQLAEFRSYEGQEMHTKDKIVPVKLDLRVNNTVIRDQFLWDVSNFESDPEEFARIFCKDLDIEDPEVGLILSCSTLSQAEVSSKPAIAIAIREQLYEVAVQSVSSARDSRVGKAGRRGAEIAVNSKAGSSTADLMKLFSSKGSVVRKRKDWYLYEPIVDILSNEEVEALDAKEERSARLKKKMEEQEDSFHTPRQSRG